MVDKKTDTHVETKATSTRSTTKDAVTEAKKRAAAQVSAQRRRAAVTRIVIGVIVVGLLSALVAFIVRQGAVDGLAIAGPSGAAVASSEGGFGVGSSGVVGKDLDPSRVRLDVYFDFICPACGSFEQSQSATLNELRAAGTVDVYYHPLAYQDDKSMGTQYSTRAASAAALVAVESPETFMAFLESLFAAQPSEGTTGLSDEQIQELATAAGVPEAVVSRIPDYEYAAWVRSASDAASRDGVRYTPTLGFDGDIQDPTDAESVQWGQDGALRQAIIERSAG